MSASVAKMAPVELGDIEHVAAFIREADRVEVYEGSRRDPLTAMKYSVARSERSAVLRVDEEPVAVFGVGRLSLLSGVGVPWMLGTDMLKANAKLLLPMAPLVVRKMMQGHDVLRNVVHEDNKASIRWLEYMGFRMGNPVEAGWRGAMFLVFELNKDEINV